MIPKTLQDIHYRMYLDFLEAVYEANLTGVGRARYLNQLCAEPDRSTLLAVEKLTRGQVKVLGFFDSYHTEHARMEEKISKMLLKKDRVFKFIYTLPNEDGHFLVVTKARMEKWDPWRRKE